MYYTNINLINYLLYLPQDYLEYLQASKKTYNKIDNINVIEPKGYRVRQGIVSAVSCD